MHEINQLRYNRQETQLKFNNVIFVEYIKYVLKNIYFIKF